MSKPGKKSKANRDAFRRANCVYCGEPSICTDDHVIPQCLFPQREALKKSDYVIVPACNACNNLKSKDDGFIRDIFVADISCWGRNSTKALFPKVFRSISANRTGLRKAFLNESRIEGADSPGGIYLGDYRTVPLDWNRLARYLKWVVAGLFWKHFGTRFPASYGFVVRRVPVPSFAEAVGQVQNYGGSGPYYIGDDVFGYAFIAPTENRFLIYWMLWFYDNIPFIVISGPQDFISQQRLPDRAPRAMGLW